MSIPSTRLAVGLDGAGRIHVLEQPVPRPAAGQVLLEMRASAISPGTELGGVKARREKPSEAPPRVFGYGNAGVIAALGEGVEPRLSVGQRVAAMGGGYAEHATWCCVPQNMVVPLPPEVDFESGAFTCLAATALHAVRRAEVTLGQHLAVFGLGPVGQLALQLGQVAGAHGLGIDRLDNRLAAARAAGALATVNPTTADLPAAGREFSRGYGFDAAILAFGGNGTAAVQQAYELLKLAPDTHRWGVIVAVGGVTAEVKLAAGFGNVDLRSSARPGAGYHDDAWEHGAHYPDVFVEWTTRRNLEECLRFMAQGRLRVPPLITHRGSIREAPALCNVLVDSPNEAIGVVLLPD
ncbi:MAG: zinc-binding alcohol dehydrogenase [Fimbriimonadaceae bacterium]|nr:zinc-binding alcohol dehydrogenase [Fimbriimonadaceae bacterium]